jgi:O-antigen ligase
LRQNAAVLPARADALVSSPPTPGLYPSFSQEPLRIGVGLAAFVFYLWLVHSYKLPAGEIAVLLLGVGVLLRGGSLRFPALLQLFLALIVWSAASLITTTSTTVTTDALIDLAKLWVITFCVVNVVRTAAELRFVMIAWLAVFALYPVRGALYNQYICHCTEFGRVAWNFQFNNPNDLAALSIIPLGIAAGIATVEKKTKIFRIAALIGVGVLALLVMLTQSRGAILAIGTSVLLLPLTSKRKGRDLFLLLALFGVAAIVAPKDVWDRVSGLSNVSIEADMKGVDKEGSAEARWDIWKIAAATARANPVFGVGAGMMPSVHRVEAARQGLNYSARGNRDTHSTYLRIAAEVGFPGLALYLVMWGSVFWRVRKARRSVRATRPGDHQMLFYIELAMLSYMVASIFGTYGSIASTYVSIAVCWLAAEILEKEPWYGSVRSAVPQQQVVARRR